MDLMSLATEIRLAIYADLLIQRDGPINFEENYDQLLQFRIRPTKTTTNLCPALLRVSKQVYTEAISILYSKNCFRFSDLTSVDDLPTRHPIAVFLDEIGTRNASLLHHVCVSLTLEDWPGELQLRDLDVLRDHPNVCLGITTLELELTLEPVHFLASSDSPVSSRSLDLVSERLQGFPSLRKVEVDLRLLGWEESDADDGKSDRHEGVVPLGQEQEQQEQAQEYGLLPPGRHLKARREDLVKQMGDRGWVTKVTEIPLAESISGDAHSWWGPEFYEDYMSEREEEELSDYYHERQVEGYRRGYADDGGPA